MRLTSNPSRHSFATTPVADEDDVRTAQELLGHKDARTSMPFYDLVPSGKGFRSLLDAV